MNTYKKLAISTIVTLFIMSGCSASCTSKRGHIRVGSSDTVTQTVALKEDTGKTVSTLNGN